MKPIVPPYWLWPDAVPAWHRIVSNLQRRGAWQGMYELIAAVAATQCASYCQLARRRVPEILRQRHPEWAEVAEESRRLARLLLSDMGYLPENRVPIGTLDPDGNDAEIMAICRPLEDA